MDRVLSAVARRLERGAFAEWPLARAAAGAWERAAKVERPLVWPERVRLVAVGGATLGGSGKTPLAIALAACFASAGEAVALIGHAYGARPARARVVAPCDAVEDVGDEALVCARALAGSRAEVVVAKSRQAAVDLAVARGAERLVVDGMLQATPRRADRSLLALDPHEPWGAGAVPPMGDLRASRDALLAACDEVVVLHDRAIRSRGARVEDRMVTWSALETLRVGLLTSTARPARITRFLAQRGIFPVATAHAPDHRPPRIPRGVNVDVWLATEKCAASVTRPSGPGPGAPLARIEYVVDLHALGLP